MSAKTVETLDEWARYAASTDHPQAFVVGDLARQIRTRLDVPDGAFVFFYEERWVRWDELWCTCCEGEGTNFVVESAGKTATFEADYSDCNWREFHRWLDAPRRQAEREAAEKVSREREDAIATAIGASIHAAAEAVEAEGYSSDEDWHDKLMTRLGVKGYAA